MTPLAFSGGVKPTLGIEIAIQPVDSHTQGLVAATILNALLPYLSRLENLSMNLDGQILIKQGGSQKAVEQEIESLIEVLKSAAPGSVAKLLPILP